MGAYTNPKLYGIDYSVVGEAMSQMGAKIAYATAKRQEERAKLEKEFKDSYKDFISKAYLDSNDYLGEEYRNSLNASYQDVENFANMSEAEKQNIIRNVQSTNAGMQEIATKMPEIATMDIDINKYDDPSVRLLGAMARGDKGAFKSVKDPNNPMLINWQYTEKDPETGETKTYDIPMKDLRMSMASVQDISPRIDAIDNELTTLAGQYQKNMDSFATRGARFNWEDKFNAYFEGMDEEELDLYYRNAFPDIRGVDYTPDVNPATGEAWGDSKEEQEEREKLFNEKKQDLKTRLKQKIAGKVVETPLAVTDKSVVGGTTKTEKFNPLPQNTRQDLKEALDISITDPTGEKTTTRRGELGFEYEDIQFNDGKRKIYKTTATNGLIGKQIQTGDKTIFVRDAFILDGKVHITDRDYVPGEGYMPTDVLELPAEGLNNILVTGSAPVENDPLGLGI